MKKLNLFIMILIVAAIGFSGCAGTQERATTTAEPAVDITDYSGYPTSSLGPSSYDASAGEPLTPVVSTMPAVAEDLPVVRYVQPEQPEAAVPVTPRGISGAAIFSDVYFDFDRYSIRDDARATLNENARALAASGKSVVIEGHCDERGTIEYNIALGQRRAKAIKEYLTDLGVAPSRLSIISYGKERPQCTDRNEDCWQQNRRGHIVAR